LRWERRVEVARLDVRKRLVEMSLNWRERERGM
jgi:hypothetical protein